MAEAGVPGLVFRITERSAESSGQQWCQRQLPVVLFTHPARSGSRPGSGSNQLYILEFYGTVIDVGLAITPYNTRSASQHRSSGGA